MTHEQMDFTSELADDMAALIDKWRNYTRNNELI
jgi:23S rRNA pseudouridine1911/1915/1917 synthase